MSNPFNLRPVGEEYTSHSVQTIAQATSDIIGTTSVEYSGRIRRNDENELVIAKLDKRRQTFLIEIDPHRDEPI